VNEVLTRGVRQMATNWVRVNDEYGQIDVNLDNVAYMRPTEDGWTTLTFIDHEQMLVVRETPDQIRSQSSMGRN
jgi:hypothetical protein